MRNATIAAELQAEMNATACEETFYPKRNKYEYKYCCNLYAEEEDHSFDGIKLLQKKHIRMWFCSRHADSAVDLRQRRRRPGKRDEASGG